MRRCKKRTNANEFRFVIMRLMSCLEIMLNSPNWPINMYEKEEKYHVTTIRPYLALLSYEHSAHFDAAQSNLLFDSSMNTTNAYSL